MILQGDVTIERLVEAIKASRVWNEGHNAIVIVWDENDYSGISTTPNGLFPPQNQNQVVLTVETNYDERGRVSERNLLHQLLALEIHGSGIWTSLPQPRL